MTVVVLGIDALDPDLVDPAVHPNLALEDHRSIDTIASSAGEPSTHELWPTIITGLEPVDHGLLLDDGVTWEHPVLALGARAGQFVLPDSLRTRIGAWLLNNTEQDQFRVESSYYEQEGLETIFDGRDATAIGVPNYVTNPDEEDREHQLRRSLGDLFERDPDAETGHRSSDPETFYEQCLEMAMIRIARVRRALRGRRNELVFGYTSGLDLIGHVAVQREGMQAAAYEEIDEFVGDLRGDLRDDDELVLVSDHGLQDGVHTHEAMVASTDSAIVDAIRSVLDVREAVANAIDRGTHPSTGRTFGAERDPDQAGRVQEQLEDLGYL